jgi:hypothetical protein
MYWKNGIYYAKLVSNFKEGNSQIIVKGLPFICPKLPMPLLILPRYSELRV